MKRLKSWIVLLLLLPAVTWAQTLTDVDEIVEASNLPPTTRGMMAAVRCGC